MKTVVNLKTKTSKVVSLTAEENAARELEEQVWADGEPARKWAGVRAQRDALLAASDYTSAWATYRQALRDVPASQSDVDNITWPIEPD